ncbi:cation:proton antiporter [Streptomyces sp. MN03-5084-2B]|nr:cation:proton antiporter [Streptomyces sp. MN03-5084-2B]
MCCSALAAGSPPSLGQDRVLVFLAQLCGLLVVAFLCGRLAKRFRLPAVAGELLGGVLLGPSVLGNLPAELSAWLPQRDPQQLALLEVVGQIGLVLLVALAGAHTDLKLLLRQRLTIGRVSGCGLLVPLALGVGTGFLLPASLLGGDRLPFALFLGVALSLSAIPVIVSILTDLGLDRRPFGQLATASAVVDDTVGWLLLALLTTTVTTGITVGAVAVSVGSLLLVVGAAATIGRRAVRAALTAAARAADPRATVALVIIMVLSYAVLTQIAGFEAVLGAFLCGMTIASLDLPDDVLAPLRTVVTSTFAPVFFVLAGMRMDLSSLADPAVLLPGICVLAVAVLGKFAGAYAGARWSRAGHWEAIALGAALNARGVIEVVVATVGLSLGILVTASYTIVVLIAIVTSVMAPPIVRLAVARIPGESGTAPIHDGRVPRFPETGINRFLPRS